MIPVTRPFLPPISEYQKLIEEIFMRNWLTNNGPLINELELLLKERFGVNHGIVVSNGTIALQIALKALGVKGKVLTTPFSYIATASSIAWEGCQPVFVDIEADAFNVSPESILNKLDRSINAILLTHCFGIPLDVKQIDNIAKEAGIPVIYDAAHAFGSHVDGRSIFTYGDISTCSFHATKIFHMVEGGGIFTSNSDVLRTCAWMRNFGHNGPSDFEGVGINGKNSEFHSAMGLINLRYIDGLLEERKIQHEAYNALLGVEPAIRLPSTQDPGWNRAYYPILLDSEAMTMKVLHYLQQFEIFPRRYFHPSLQRLNGWEGDCPNSDSVSSRVLCLPLYSGLQDRDQQMIARYILRTIRN